MSLEVEKSNFILNPPKYNVDNCFIQKQDIKTNKEFNNLFNQMKQSIKIHTGNVNTEKLKTPNLETTSLDLLESIEENNINFSNINNLDMDNNMHNTKLLICKYLENNNLNNVFKLQPEVDLVIDKEDIKNNKDFNTVFNKIKEDGLCQEMELSGEFSGETNNSNIYSNVLDNKLYVEDSDLNEPFKLQPTINLDKLLNFYENKINKCKQIMNEYNNNMNIQINELYSNLSELRHLKNYTK